MSSNGMPTGLQTQMIWSLQSRPYWMLTSMIRTGLRIELQFKLNLSGSRIWWYSTLWSTRRMVRE